MSILGKRAILSVGDMLINSRTPDDLPGFMKAISQVLK